MRVSDPNIPRRASAFGAGYVALLLALSFAVMADPVSSVAYAIEAGLRALHGHLNLLVLTMGMVLGIIFLVRLNYTQLIRRFPQGGGAVAATAAAFGEAWAFAPLGALIVDFVLTISISTAAASSAVIAYFPALEPRRTLIAVLLTCLVAGLTWYGHGGRSRAPAKAATHSASHGYADHLQGLVDRFVERHGSPLLPARAPRHVVNRRPEPLEGALELRSRVSTLVHGWIVKSACVSDCFP